MYLFTNEISLFSYVLFYSEFRNEAQECSSIHWNHLTNYRNRLPAAGMVR